ncbi:hypothetical protein WJX75_000738 [Coccomyxa subellipsoidea]|uniref:Prepilin-type N-terminal cleavage/methylation domain-containing protein n=1 Tax=Coccomyxa subellipsoidea TaxID=248742 RepID=A0ABR2YT58_9CHLO
MGMRQACSQPARCSTSALCNSRFLTGTTVPRCNIPQLATSRRQQRMVTRMGLFGLGVPEIAVIAGVAVLIFGV